MAGPKTDSTGQLQRKPKTNGQVLSETLLSYRDQIAMAVPKHVTAERMARLAVTALRQTRGLDQCDPSSFMGCILQCAQLGLEPNTPLGHAYLIPRNVRGGGKQCTLLLGYQGFIDLARRSGLVTSVRGHVVRQGDQFEYAEGLEPKLVHVPSDRGDRESAQITHAYAVARMRDAPPEFEVLSIAQIHARMNRSQAAGSGPWQTDFEAMAKKTAVRALWKWLPKSAEIARAEAVEVAVDTHAKQSDAWDPSVNEALERKGLLPAGDEGAEDTSD